ncbi:MAG: hypothetical protein COY58_06985 [Gammaproteobacteria bacterium CG_4_10_14_0_8_um_filter_38_16]|nr:MAG: hypothetical protein COY58_06985 [Gammaproteobacteria bacterium CG_4_10_14_0_8_um_filter_38_16]PJA04206.1 MAG: hypothetical protein COX72_01130 [Gammaproteobacteria bacterium CG_4_10_14_0_2_um_filter_38_22]PJB11042.1 MAG: hypothetical protein CO120_01630 [Gammaproteobacteria bacterium CG_4_9_14_3_um_filter_38_9]
MPGNAKRVEKAIRWYAVSGLLLAGLIIALVAIIPFQARLFDMQKQHLIYSRELAVMMVDAFFQQLQDTAKQISIRIDNQPGQQQADIALQKIAQDELSAHASLIAIARVDKNDKKIFFVGAPTFKAQAIKKWVKEKPFLFELLEKNRHSLSISVPYISKKNQTGYDIFTFQLQKLEKMIHEKMKTKSSETFVYYIKDNHLHWLLDRDEDQSTFLFLESESLKHALTSAIKKKSSGVIFKNNQKTQAILTYASEKNMPWGVVVYANKAVLYHSITRIILILLTVIGVILFLFAVGLTSVLRPLSGRLLLRNEELEELVQKSKHELQTMNDQLYHIAMHDSLTNLMTRRAFYLRATEELSRCKRYQRSFAFFYIDLDHFKWVNDTIGHDAGDFLLKAVAMHLLSSVRKEDLVARLGGDEFVILITEKTDQASLNHVLSRVKSLEASPIYYAKQKINVKLSVGLAVYPEDADDISALLKIADYRMYQNKIKSRENV